jgi:KaiC/GvpD/RAD55 family RecA-like ATPase
MAVFVKEARKILGKMAKEMTDKEITKLVDNLDAIAIDALRQAREKRIEEDALAMTELIYDIYVDRKINDV